MCIFHKGGQMSDPMEEDCKNSYSSQETSAEKNMSPAKDSSVRRKKLVWLLQYYFVIKILVIAFNFISHYKKKEWSQKRNISNNNSETDQASNAVI